MAVPSPRPDLDADTDDESAGSLLQNGVSLHTTSPDRRVFVEDGNTDGWIATGLTVELER